MLTPAYLKTNDTVAIVAPAGNIANIDIDSAINIIKDWGFNVVEGKHLRESYFKYSGTVQQRTSDLQSMLDDPNIKAIFCARGGYGTIEVIDNLKFDAFVKNPKWIVGYSDITALHAHINNVLQVETIHAIMPSQYSNPEAEEAVNALKDALFGKPVAYKIESSLYNKKGEAYGNLTGGNLSVLYALNSNPEDVPQLDSILFIEDVGEHLYHIDRMLINFKRSGKLSRFKGVIVGGFTDLKEDEKTFGKNVNQIILQHLENYDIPVCFNFPAGHFFRNMPLIMGRNITLSVKKDFSEIIFDQKEGDEKIKLFNTIKPIIKYVLYFLAFFAMIGLLFTFFKFLAR
ncbi:MAG: LD-carboxypeptidase [Bacteroidales bacterium]